MRNLQQNGQLQKKHNVQTQTQTQTRCTLWLMSQYDTPCSSMSTLSSILIIPAYKKHHHRVSPSHTIQFNLSGKISLTLHILYSLQDYTYKTVQIVYAATQQTTSTYCNYNIWQLTAFYRVYFITNYKHFNLLNILSFIILMIFVTLAK